MGKRSSKAEGALLGLAVVVGLPIYLVSKVFEVTGWVVPLLVCVAIITIAVYVRYAKKQKRLAYLRSRYAEDVVQKIYHGYFWQGQTEDELLDSLGGPVEVDHKVLKTMRREVWKYNRTGANRFALRITVENGYVAGWDKKA